VATLEIWHIQQELKSKGQQYINLKYDDNKNFEMQKKKKNEAKRKQNIEEY